MVASENPEVIEEGLRLIATDVIDSEESSEDGSICNNGDSSDEEYDIGLGYAGVITGVTESGTKEVEEVNQDMEYSYLLSYMLKPTSLITQGFTDNNKSQENIFKRMCNFGAQS